jgi:flagellar protein FliS
MTRQAAIDAYRREAIENAPPLKLVRMMYEGALRNLAKALECDAEDPGSEFSTCLMRADAIVAELRCSLDRRESGGVVENLEQLYRFVEVEIARAIQDRSLVHVGNAQRVLSTLLDGWAGIGTDGAGGADRSASRFG